MDLANNVIPPIRIHPINNCHSLMNIDVIPVNNINIIYMIIVISCILFGFRQSRILLPQ